MPASAGSWTMPPGMCPLAQQLTLLEEGALQTCGKCVPCRDGLPQLAEMLRHLVDCQADAAEVERMRALAEMVRDTSDCAIGYESANALLEGLDAFAAEVESHVSKHECQRSVGQSVPCETFCPAHVNVPAYIALVAQGDYAGAVQMIRKDNPFPTALGVRASLRAALPSHAHRRAAQHPRHQGVRLRARARRPGARAETPARNRSPRGGRGRWPVRLDLRVLRRLDGPRR